MSGKMYRKFIGKEVTAYVDHFSTHYEIKAVLEKEEVSSLVFINGKFDLKMRNITVFNREFCTLKIPKKNISFIVKFP